MAFEANRELKKEYRNLLGAINQLVFHLNDPEDAKQCLLWLTKLEEEPIDEKLRNQILTQLLENVMRKRLEHPFTENPYDAPLDDFFTTGKSTFHSMDPNPSIFDSDSGISKYRARSKQYKKTITEYQRIMRNMLKAKNDSTINDLPVVQNWKNARKEAIPAAVPISQNSCQCEEEDTQTPNDNSLLIRVKNLESKTDNLEIKISKAETNSKSKSSRNRPVPKQSDKMERKYKAQLERFISQKDATINQLKNDILHEISLQGSSQLEDMFQTKINQLENSYQKKIQDLSEKNRKEREKDQKTIESLQKRLSSM